MSWIHSDRLNAKKAHQGFAAGIKKAVRKMGRELPGPSGISPSVLGAEPLSFSVPPTLDRALGYGGNLRFVQFGYSAKTRQFEYCDGGDDIPSASESLWKWFLRHPVISSHLPESRYPTLYGVFPAGHVRPTIDQIMGKGGSFPVRHYLLLDRQEQKAYIAQREQTLILFALAEPEDGDPHTLYVDDLLMSPGTENYKAPPPEEFVHEVRRFLDAQLEASGDA